MAGANLKMKRAIAGIPIPIILGIIVVILVSGGLLWGTGRGIAEKIFGEKGPIPIFKGQEEFVPYTAQLEASDRIAIDSMNALACAINAVSSGDPGKCDKKDTSIAMGDIGGNEILGAAVAEGEQKTCNAQFGQACVTCGNAAILGESGKASTIDEIGKMIENCAIKSKWASLDTYCGYIVGGRQGASIKKAELEQWLKTKAGVDTRVRINSDFLIAIKEPDGVITPERGYHICADDDGIDNEIYIYDSVEYDNDCKDVYDVWKKKRNQFSADCTVQSFELPQKVQKVGLFNPVSWVAGNNDPDYVAYFEAFPRGMEKFWHVDEISVVSVSLVVGFAAFDAIPAFGKLAKGAYQAFKQGAKDTAQLMAEKGVRSGLKAFFDSVFTRGWKNAIRKQYIADLAEGYAYGIEKELAGKISEKAESLLIAEARRGASRAEATAVARAGILNTLNAENLPVDPRYLKQALEDYASGFKKHVDELLPDEKIKVLSSATESYRREVASELTEQAATVYGTRLTKAFARELAKRMAVKQFFKQMFKEGAEEISEEQVKQGVGKALRKLASMPPDQRRRAVQEGVQLSEEYLTKDGLLDFTKITGKSFADPDGATRKLTKEFIDAIATPEGTSLAGLMLDSGWSTVTALKRGTVGPHNPLTEPFKFFGDQIPISFKAFGLGTVPKAAQWIKNHKYPIIAALALYAASQDAANEKYESVGINSLGMTRPYARGRAMAFELLPNATPYYIAPKDEGDNVRGERLYLVSPCKADLLVQTDICECSRVPIGNQHWKFSENLPRLDLTGITLNTEVLGSDDKVYNNFVNWHTNEQFKSAWLTMPEAEAINRIKDEKLSERNKSLIYKKYPMLWEFNPDYNSITTRKGAIAAWQRLEAVDFFEKQVNGLALGATNSYGVLIGIRAEEPKDSLPQVMWDEFAAYFDFSGVQKTCVQRGTFDEWVGAAVTVYTDMSGQKLKLENNIFAHPVYKTDCITVGITRDKAYTTENGANYCIDEYSYLTTARYIFFATELVASVALTAITGGTAAPFLIATTGIVSGLTEEWLARQAKWPAYEREGQQGKVPIAQTKVSEAEWSAFGGAK
jgi:hypothetical protein